MIIKVLCPGCTSCVALERVTRDAVATLGLREILGRLAS